MNAQTVISHNVSCEPDGRVVCSGCSFAMKSQIPGLGRRFAYAHVAAPDATPAQLVELLREPS